MFREERKDVGQPGRETKNHGQDSEPLSVDTEIPGLEFFLERHFGGLWTKLTSSQENGVYSGGLFVMRAMALQVRRRFRDGDQKARSCAMWPESRFRAIC